MVIKDSKELLYSKEGVTQGDPLSMFVYAVATIPMIDSVGRSDESRDVWYADDTSACSSLSSINEWFSALLHRGLSYGYHPEARKCILVVNPDHLDSAHQIFNGFGVQVKMSHRLLE